jgi:hypothetical protein
MSKIGELRSALRILLDEHVRDSAIPTSARFLFYELVMREILSKQKKEKGRCPDQDMQDALTDLRESGDVPWEWIIDETRSLDDFTGYRTIQDYVLGVLLDPWEGEQPLILTESRSLAGVLRAACREYSICIASTNGQCRGFLHTRIAPMLHEDHRVLYLGDFDLCGNDIEQNTKSVLERASGKLLLWERLALTHEQVIAYDLPKIIKTDRRFSNGGGTHEAVETEALSQRIILEIVRNRLDELLPESLESVQERADTQQAIIRQKLSI